jgi:uncharacterized phage infection (PIP) family protein YhgE
MPAAPRIVTGNVATLTGEARAGIKVTFTRKATGDVFAQYGDVVVNEPVSVTSGEGGALSVTLYPGDYDVLAAGSNGPKRFTAALAEDGSDDLADLIAQASNIPLTPSLVAQTAGYRDEAEAAAIATAADRVQTGLDADATAADRVQTGLDADATAADRVQTGLDRLATGEDRAATGADAVATAADRIATGADATATAADRVATGQDAVATAADRIQTGLDRSATAADRVQTGIDAAATAADRVQTGLDQIATAADRVQTGLDRIATAADRVQTGLDVAASDAARTGAETAEDGALAAQAAAEAARDLADADAIATAADRVQTGLDRTAAETANTQAQAASGIHSAVAEQVGAVAAAFGQAYEELVKLTDAQDDNTVNTAALMALAQMLGQIADQVNGGQVTLSGGTLADPALRIGTAGIYSAATNTLSVAIAGVERLRVTTSGITVFGTVTES